MAPGLQASKSQVIGEEFRGLHLERVAYTSDTRNKKIHKEN
jgi:hypothetical protein